MKRDKIIYWTATGLVAAMMLMSAYMYLTRNPGIVAAFQSAGYPIYFMMLLGTAKLLGAVALVAPIGERLKEWAYAGFIFTFVGATVTHIATSTPWIAPVISLAILAVSYVFWVRVRGLSVAKSHRSVAV